MMPLHVHLPVPFLTEGLVAHRAVEGVRVYTHVQGHVRFSLEPGRAKATRVGALRAVFVQGVG